MPAAALLEAVTKRFKGQDRAAVDNLSAVLEPGRITGLVGPDGAGKTTTLRLLAALLPPASGRVIVAGEDAWAEPERVHAMIGYMPQRFGLYEDLSVIGNLKLYARLRGLTGEERKATFERLLRFTDLARFTDRLAGKLSGGMKQKLGLACALIRKPRLLLLDEPSVGVDPISRRELWRMVRELLDEGIAVVWATAYLDEAERCDEVLLLNEGRLLFAGPPREMTARVEGRTFLVHGVRDRRRQALATALERPEIADGVIQGRAIRLVARPQATLQAAGIIPDGARIEPATPRFEDAFIDALGGGPGGRSALAERMPHIAGDHDVVIETDRLTKRFGSFTAAGDISLRIRRGEIFCLLGPNGAGKSTTFKMLCGLLPPTSGSARVAGHDLRIASSQARGRIGYMAQKFSLYGLLSVQQNLEFFSGVYGLSGRRQKAAVEQMVDSFGLGPYLKASAEDLPLGFKQRLALSCAVMHEPEVLFLDEPTSGVDPITRREFWNHINGLVEKGVTIMVTTHFMDEAEYCDRLSLVYRGRTIATGSPDELKEGVGSAELPNPTLEDAFIALVERSDAERAA